MLRPRLVFFPLWLGAFLKSAHSSSSGSTGDACSTHITEPSCTTAGCNWMDTYCGTGDACSTHMTEPSCTTAGCNWMDTYCSDWECHHMNDYSSCTSVARCEWRGFYCSVYVEDIDADKRCPAVMSGRGLTCTHDEVRTDIKPCGSSNCSDTVAYTDDHILTECCITMCDDVMASRGLSCDSNSDGYLDVSSWLLSDTTKSDTEIKSACCTKNCEFMFSQRELTCNSGTQRGSRDLHKPCDDHMNENCPTTSDEHLLGECCIDTCESVFSENGYSCPAGQFPDSSLHHIPDSSKSEYELQGQCCKDMNCYHYMMRTDQTCLFGKVRDSNDSTRPDDADGNDWSSVNAQEECCIQSCYDHMNDQQLQCPSNTRGRTEHDQHNPFDTLDWSTFTPQEIIDGCCSINCYTEMTGRSLTCVQGRMRGEFDFHNPWDEYLSYFPSDKSDAELIEVCCEKNCVDVMSERSLTCTNPNPNLLRSRENNSPCDEFMSCNDAPDPWIEDQCCVYGTPVPSSACENPIDWLPEGAIVKYCGIKTNTVISQSTCGSYGFHMDPPDYYCYTEVPASTTDNECTDKLTADGFLPHTDYTMEIQIETCEDEVSIDGRNMIRYCYHPEIMGNYDLISNACCGGNKMICDSSPGSDTGSVVFTSSGKDCQFNRNPQTKGEQRAVNVGISVNSTLYVAAPDDTTDLFTRIKMTKPSFNKKDMAALSLTERKAYRSMHIDKYFHHCTHPSMVDPGTVAAHLAITEDDLTSEWPLQSGYAFFEVTLPAFEFAQLHSYDRFRVEVSLNGATVPVGDGKVRSLVHACSKKHSELNIF